ncbi:hypothetical protein GC169_03585 [bacterium]|nr:hypothetical protein [bacterium]
MMTEAQRTFEFAMNASTIPSRASLTAAFQRLVEPIGGRGFAALFMSGAGHDARIISTVDKLPPGWAGTYLTNDFESDDAVFQSALRRGVRGYWDEHVASISLHRSAERVMGATREFGLRDGYTSRVLLDDGGVAVAMVYGEQLDRSPKARTLLHWGAHIFANRGAALAAWRLKPKRAAVERVRAGPELTEKQLQVLLLRAKGASNKSVAEQLQVTEKTVEAHVNAIMTRLGARNMIDAVRIACELGWVG